MIDRIKDIFLEIFTEKVRPIWLKARSLIFFFSLVFLLVLSWQLREILIFQSKQDITLTADSESFPLDNRMIANGKGDLSLKGDDSQVATFIKVSITGAIEKPGIYQLKSGSVVADLINLAGGIAKNADNSYLAKNLPLARILQPQEQIYIPNDQEQSMLAQLVDLNKGVVSVTPNPTTAIDPLGKINLNTATLDQLDLLPGVGQSTAQKIISARPFVTIDDIKKVSGIGDATYLKIKDLIEV